MNIQKQLSMDLSKGSLPGDENAIVAGPQLPSLSVIPSQVDASSATLASLPIDICYNLYSYLGRVEIQILALASATSTSSVDGPANAIAGPIPELSPSTAYKTLCLVLGLLFRPFVRLRGS